MTILKSISDYFDIKKNIGSIKRNLAKEYRINPDITIENALNEIWADLDVSLIYVSNREASERIGLVKRSIDKLGLDKIKTIRVCDYLPAHYLSSN